MIVNAEILTASVNTLDFPIHECKQAVFYLKVTAAGGTTPTLDVVIKAKNPKTGDYTAIATFAQKTTTGAERLTVATIYEGEFRAEITIGGTTPSFTFSLDAELKD